MSQPWYDYGVSQAYGVNGEQGVDLKTPFHTPITNVYSGKVVEAQYGAAGGIVGVLVNVPGLGPVVEYFLHLDIINVVKGQAVKAGQLIGLSGGENPGYPGGQHPASKQFSSGPHTEFGFFAGTPFASKNEGDPYPYLVSATGGKLPNGYRTNARFATAGTTASTANGSIGDYFGGLVGGIGQFMGGFLPTNWFNGSGDNPFTGTVALFNGITGNIVPNTLQSVGDATGQAIQSGESALGAALQFSAFFLLALVLIILGLVLIAHDPSQPGAAQSVPGGLLKHVVPE